MNLIAAQIRGFGAAFGILQKAFGEEGFGGLGVGGWMEVWGGLGWFGGVGGGLGFCTAGDGS